MFFKKRSEWKENRSIIDEREEGDVGQIIWKGACPDGAGDRFLLRLGKDASTVMTGTLADAESALKQMVTEVEADVFTPIKNIRLDTYIERYALPRKRVSSKTMMSYRGYYQNWIRKQLGHHAVRSLNKEQIQKWVDELYEELGLGEKSVKEALTLLRYALTQAVADKLMRDNPTDGVNLNRPYGNAVEESMARLAEEEEALEDPLAEKEEWDDVDLTRIWTQDEVQHFAEVAPIDDEMTRWVLLAIRSGLRPGEQCALRWRDLSLKEGVLSVAGSVREVDPDDGVGNGSRWVHVDFAKTGESIREVTLSDDAVRVLKLQKEDVGNRYRDGRFDKRQAQYVFPSRGKNRYQNPGTIKDRLRHLILGRKNRKSCPPLDGVRWIPIYGYRHTHATDLLRHRWSTFMVAKRLGTSSEMVDRHYGHLLRDMVEPVMGSMTPLPGVTKTSDTLEVRKPQRTEKGAA